MDQTPEFNPLDFLPLAEGLTDSEIAELLKLVRAETDEKILEIRSKRADAEVVTGFLADGEAGDGHTFNCVRTGDGWKIKEAGQWIA